MNTIKIDKQGRKVQMIAHRGVSGLERENTCAAFIAAGNRETYWGIETDVNCTADGKYIIIHDDNTLRVTGQDMVVENTDMQTLRSLHVLDRDSEQPRGDLVLPTLQEYITICKRYEKTAVLELKNPMPESAVCEIMQIITEMEYTHKLLVISFNLNNLIYLRKHYPDQPAQYLLSKWDDKWLEVLQQYNLGLDIYFPQITGELVDKIHGIGKQVNCWTVNTPEDAARVIESGVDQITTNILE